MADTICWLKLNGSVINMSKYYHPCGSPLPGDKAVACCDASNGCLSNGFCHHPEDVPGGSHYSLAGCTDPTFRDGSCFSACGNEPSTDVSWDYATGRWSCCGSLNGVLQCDKPLGQQIDAVPFPQLFKRGLLRMDGTFVPEPDILVASFSASAASVLAHQNPPSTMLATVASLMSQQSAASPLGAAVSTSTCLPTPTTASGPAFLTALTGQESGSALPTLVSVISSSQPVSLTSSVVAGGDATRIVTSVASSATLSAPPPSAPNSAAVGPPQGAIVGASIGLVLLGAFAAALILFCIGRRRHGARTLISGVCPANGHTASAPYVMEKMGMQINSLTLQELEHAEPEVPELHSHSKPVELESVRNAR